MALKDGSLKAGVSAFSVTTFTHLVIVAIITLVLVWLLHFREGLAFNSHTKNKIFNLHPLLMARGFILISGQVFKFHAESGFPNMYSLHSWLGLSTICLFGLQEKIAPWHAVFGMVIFFMAILTVEIGLVEKFYFLHLTRNQEAIVMNFIGVLILLFAVSVSVTIRVPSN